MVWQVVSQNGSPELCLAACSMFDGGSLSSALQTLKTWMDANPTEVVTLILRNLGGFAPYQLAQSFTAAGLDKISYAGKATVGDTWPTLGSMVKSGNRLVVFATGIVGDPSIPYILSMYEYMWETTTSVPSDSPTFACNKDNPTVGGIPVMESLYMMNHFVVNPQVTVNGTAVGADPTATTQVNTANSINAQVQTCLVNWGLRPNFISLNFAEQGDGLSVVTAMNTKQLGNTEVQDNAGTQTSDAVAAARPTVLFAASLVVCTFLLFA